MSGGSFNYMCYRVDDEYSGRMEDDELNALLKDFVEVLHDLEWWQSADIGEDTYRKTVTAFKNKWLKQYNKDKCYEFCPHKALTQAVKRNLEEIERQENDR